MILLGTLDSRLFGRIGSIRDSLESVAAGIWTGTGTTFFDDLRFDPQAYVHTLADFLGIRRFTLMPEELKGIYTSETMTHPRSYYRRLCCFAAGFRGPQHRGCVQS